jgi:hypothetical protein
MDQKFQKSRCCCFEAGHDPLVGYQGKQDSSDPFTSEREHTFIFAVN